MRTARTGSRTRYVLQMRLTLYKQLASYLQHEVPALKWVDWDFGQFDLATDKYPLPCPCVLVGIGAFSYSDLPNNVQEGTMSVTISLYIRKAGDLQATSAKQTQTLQALSLLDALSSVLHNRFSTDSVQPFLRREETPLQTASDLIGVSQTYEARLVDSSMQDGYPQQKKLHTKPVITTNHNQ